MKKVVSPFYLLRSSVNLKYPVVTTSKTGNAVRLDISKEDDQLGVKDFVESIHAQFYSFDEAILVEEKSKFPMIYPEFYDVNKWNDVLQFKCNADSTNELIGTLGIYEESNGIIYISSFYVAESYRYEGIGRLLWTSLVDFIEVVNSNAVQQGLPKYKLRLVTVKDIYEKAYNFYIKEGFQEIPIEFSSTYCTLVKMERAFT